MRLIDADKLKKTLGIDADDCDKCGWGDKRGRCVRGSDFEDACCAIEDAPTIEPPYKFDEWCTDCKEYDQERHCCPRFNRVIRAAVEEVKANFSPKRGKWIERWPTAVTNRYECSACKRMTVVEECMGKPLYAFCPWCGARMMEGDGNEAD